MVIFVHYPLATNYGPTFKGAVTNKAGDSHGAMSHDTTEILNVILPPSSTPFQMLFYRLFVIQEKTFREP